MDDLYISGHKVPRISSRLDAIHNRELQGNLGQGDGKKEPNKSELIEIPTATARPIYQIQAIWPFDLTPDALLIDEAKVTVTYKKFFAQVVKTILIKDITDATISTNIFMAALSFSGGVFNKDTGPLTIVKLRVPEAQRARRIIMGMMVFSDQKVDTTNMSISEIIAKTENLGGDH